MSWLSRRPQWYRNAGLSGEARLLAEANSARQRKVAVVRAYEHQLTYGGITVGKTMAEEA